MLFEKIQFEPDEKILKTVRKHWFVIVTELFVTLVLLLVPFFILFVIALFPSQLLILDVSLGEYTGLIAFFLSAWSLLTLMVGFAIWTHYYLDMWIITDRRIILIDQVGFFNRNVSVFRLERLQDIKFYIKGIIPTILNFGTLRVQTAGALESNFKTSGLPDPRGLQAIIQKSTDTRLQELSKVTLEETPTD